MKPAARLAIILLLPLAGCETALEPRVPIAPPGGKTNPAVVIALREWSYFGLQKIRYDQAGEHISPVGFWEDEDPQSDRIRQYWEAVGKPEWTGKDCEEPWSAAFIGWVMRQAGIPADQFPPSIAHWMYLVHILAHNDDPGRHFVARTPGTYAPRPGDLACATRADTRIPLSDALPEPELLEHAKLHCNIVVGISGRELLVVGGNVRNSVSQVALPLDPKGHLQSSPEHAWFLIVENRIP